MQKTFSFIKSQLSKGFRVMLMTVVGREGSSPGKQGFTMAVASDNRFTGSIGGGVMEHRLTEQAKRLLKEKELPSPFLMFQNHDPDAVENRSGMICSGGQTIAFHPLTPDDLPVVSAVTESLEKEKKGILSLTGKGLFFYPGLEMATAMESDMESEKKWEFRWQVGMPDTLYIFGGGHVGLALSKIFRLLDFKIFLFDNRRGLNTFEENRFAHVKRVIDYRQAASQVPEGFNVYVVIVTFAHKTDEQVLAQMLDKNLKYLGLMGSAKKIETIFGRLRERGFDPERLSAVHAPVGLPVNSETPEEIAVSIAAEIIAVKNGKPA